MAISVQMFAFNTAIAGELKARIAKLASDGLPAAFAPSAYQARIFSWIATGSGSAIVRAVAGSGKTTTSVYGLSYIPGVDLTRASASTFHSAGFSALRKRSNSWTVDGKKMVKMLDERLSPRENDLYGAFVAKLVGLAKGQGLGAIAADNEESWLDLISHHDLSLDSEDASEAEAVTLARKALEWSNTAAEKTGLIDFDDQLYLPLKWRLRLWQNDFVIVDEAQDTNPVRRALAKLALRPGGRLMAVGDEKQSIYGFTGASTDAMELIKREFACVELPLTVSYRCSRAVVERAQALVPYLEAAPSAVTGSCTTAKLEDALKRLGDHDAILCRNVAPLIELAFAIIAKDRGCHVLGREIGAGLINLVKKQNAKGVDRLIEKLKAYQEREVAKFTAKGEEQKADALTDRVECIMIMIGKLGENERTIPALLAKIDSLFSDTNGVLTLSTMHKSKGREWEHVGIYRPELCPSKWARQDWQREQELNLQYVAWTRAKIDLIDILND